MVLFNYSTRELTAKIVYYGPGLCGKTTNLQYIHANLPDGVKGRMLSLATKTDRTLFFDFLPIDLGDIRGMKTRVQLYTVPGQVFYNETRKLVLKGADGIVFVADSQEPMVGANVESFRNLEENLRGHGMRLQEMPHVIQFNKRDLPRLASIEDLNSSINRYNAPFYESVATTGIGVQDTLKAVVKLVLLHLTRKYETKTDPRTSVAVPERAKPPAAAPLPRSSETVRPPAAAALRPPVAAPERPAAPQRVKLDATWPVAQEMQPLPISSFDTPLSRAAAVPTSRVRETAGPEAPRSTAPPPPDFRGLGGQGRVEEASGLSFDAEEIEDLVDEVGEFGEAPLPADDIDWAPQRHERVAAPAPAEEIPIEIVEDEPPKEAPVEEVAPAHDARASAPREPQFEVDLGFDPAWQPEETEAVEDVLELEPIPLAPEPLDAAEIVLEPIEAAPAEAVDDEVEPFHEPAATGPTADVLEELEAFPELCEPPPEPTPIPVRVADAVPAEPEAETVVLEEVAASEDLFQDPELEVARLARGEAREIVVPVEIVEGAAVRRFKLSVRLRLESLD